MAALRQDPRAWIGAAAVGGALGLVAAARPLAAVGLIAAAIGGVIIFTRPDLVLLAMIAALPWENKLQFPSPTLSMIKVIGGAVMIAYLLRLCGDRRTLIHLPQVLGVVAAFGIWIGISLIVSSDPAAGTEKLVRWALFFSFFFLVIQLVDGRAQIQRALRCFTLSVAAAAVYALVLFVGGDGYRAAGPLEDPNDFAYLLACTLPLAAYLLASDRGRRLLWGAAFTVIVGAMLATFSRGALIGIGVLVLWAILTRRVPVRALVAGLAIGLAVVAVAFTTWSAQVDEALHQKQHIAQSNTESREVLWNAALKLNAEHPVTGVGPGLYTREALPILHDDPVDQASITVTKSVAHNSYLEILAENGIPGLVLFVAYLATVWGLLRGVQKHALWVGDDDERRLATALQAAFLIAIVAATFLSEELSTPFWLLGGLAAVLSRETAFAPQPEPALQMPPQMPTIPALSA